MNADLGARLVAAGLVTREQLGLALAEVPAHGGALAAELVRQGIEEDAIAGFFVADGFGPVLSEAELEGAERALDVPGRLAVDMLALPLWPSDEGLLVAMADPSDVHAVRELTHAFGTRIVPTVARIGALERVLEKLYPEETEDAQLLRERRAAGAQPIALVRKRESQKSDPPRDTLETGPPSLEPAEPRSPLRAPEPASDAPTRRGTPAYAPSPSAFRDTADFIDGPRERPRRRDTADLLRPPRRRRDTADFAREAPGASATSEGRGNRRRRDTADFGQTPVGRDTIDGVAAFVGSDEPVSAGGGGWGELSESTAADSLARRAARAHSILPGRLPVLPDKITVSMPTGSVDPAPDLGAVLATVRAAKTRDEVCRNVCLGLAPLGRAAVLMVLSKGMFKGRDVSGGGLSVDAIRNLWIPATSRSLLRRVADSGEPYLGPHGDTSADTVFRAALGSLGADVLLMPVVLSGRTVAILVLEEPEADAVTVLERAEVLTQATAEAFRRLIVSTKA